MMLCKMSAAGPIAVILETLSVSHIGPTVYLMCTILLFHFIVVLLFHLIVPTLLVLIIEQKHGRINCVLWSIRPSEVVVWAQV